MKSFFCFERPCIAWQNCVRFFCAFIMFWANNAWLEQRTRSHAHVLYFSILTLKPCITGNLFPLCLFSKNPTPKRCDYIYHILWKKSSVLIYAERSIFCCWSFFSISSIYESIVSVITILTMPMKYIKLCIWDVRFFVIVVHCFKALLIFPSVKNSLALSLSLSLSLSLTYSVLDLIMYKTLQCNCTYTTKP